MKLEAIIEVPGEMTSSTSDMTSLDVSTSNVSMCSVEPMTFTTEVMGHEVKFIESPGELKSLLLCLLYVIYDTGIQWVKF